MTDGDTSTNQSDWPPFWPENVPAGVSLNGPDFAADAQMLIGLGSLIRSASMAEQELRSLYCALVSSPYATVTASGQMTNWLIDECIALVKVRVDLTEEQKSDLLGLLSRVKALAAQRNRFVHDVWATGPDDSPTLIRSNRRSHQWTFQPVALENLIECGRGFTECTIRIGTWIFQALGITAVGMEAQLRWIVSRSQLAQEASGAGGSPDA
jgi:hypothetical protein